MGQANSANIEHIPTNTSITKPEPIRTPRGPPKRPTNPPQPKIPNYVVAQNKVLPGQIPLDGRSNLRPVSQELAKFMPEIADIYQPEHVDEIPIDLDQDDENEFFTSPLKPGLTGPIVTPEKAIHMSKLTNDTSTPKGSNNDPTFLSDDSINNDSGIFEGEPTVNRIGPSNSNSRNGFGHIRNSSFDRNGRIKGQRRQQSVCTSLLNEQSTIPEDPREHLYNEWRKDPYSNSLPSGASLPVKSNFDMDESFNMTYAQLAEARRKKTLEDLEKRTGKKIQDLTDDLADQSTVMPSPFDRYSSKASPRVTSIAITRSNSISTASSSDTGVSKRKKKRAPPPPNQNGIVEPPVDYDVVQSAHSVSPRNKTELSTQSANTNISAVNSMPSAPPPPLNPRKKGPAPIAGGISPRKLSTGSSGITQVVVSRSGSFKTPPVMPKPPRPLSELELRLQAVRDIVEDKMLVKEYKTGDGDQDDQQDETTSMSTDTMSSMSDNLSLHSIESRTKSDTTIAQMDGVKQKIEEITEIFNETKDAKLKQYVTDKKVTEEMKIVADCESKPDNPDINSGQRKLSTLLQHDIVTAAEARGAKIVKRSTPVPSKPKDQQSVFKDQLGKALNERGDRMRQSLSIDEILCKNKQPVISGRVIDSTYDDKENIETSGSTSISSSGKIPPTLPAKKTKKIENINSESLKHELSRREAHKSNFSEDWTPEHDLDSDEDLNDHVFHSHQRTTSEGFKSQIIPSKVKDLNTGSLQRQEHVNNIYKQSEAVNGEKNKYGSIRKLRKTVHKSVKNAFGSISRASGKILRRQRIQDDEHYENSSSNWKLSTTDLNHTYPPMNGVDHSESDSDSGGMGVDDIRFDLPDTPTPQENNIKQMKRAGVAYVSGHGQLVVLPDFPTSQENDNQRVEGYEGRAPKIYRKKKKLSYESTVRKQERQQWEEQISEQIKTKELEIERERTKQMEMELEYRRLRDLESQEKMQRLQTEHIQQHLHSMQHHHQLSQNMHSGNLHNFNQSSYNTIIPPSVSQTSPITSMNLNQHNSHIINNVPHNFTSSDVNQLSDYMRHMGVPPPSTPQQWAYLLNSVNITPNPSPIQKIYVPSSAPDLSRIFTKAMDDTHQKQSMMNIMTTTQPTPVSPEFIVNGQVSAEKRQMVGIISNGKLPRVELDNASIGTLLTDFHNGTSKHKPKETEKHADKIKQRSNPVYHSSDEDNEDQLSPAIVNCGVAKIQVADHRELPAHSMEAPITGQIVYDSVGFKTVIFNPASAPHSPRSVDDSSSGADR